MGAKYDEFAALLQMTGRTTFGTLPRPRTEDILASPHTSEIMKVYRRLGGTMESPSFRPGAWDLQLDGIGVEFDEHLHFNRYRRETLQSSLYQLLPSFPVDTYVAYCDLYEEDCRRAGSYGGKWSNPSCEAHFGLAGPHGDLSTAGAPRWRQRAFYDFLKDLSPILVGTRMARVAIWDEINETKRTRRVFEAVQAPSSHTAQGLRRIVDQRAG